MKGEILESKLLSKMISAKFMTTIPTGQWSGSGSDYYITVSASNVTVNSILKPFWDKASGSLLRGPVWCVPAAGSFTIHTNAIPAGTVTIIVELAGVVGEAQYQVLSDVYSKDQVNSIVAQSTANLTVVKVDKVITLPSGTDGISTTVIDLSEYIPTGKHIHAITNTSLGTYSLPYVGDNGTVMAFLWQTKAKSVEIKNKASAWTDYHFCAVLFLADD